IAHSHLLPAAFSSHGPAHADVHSLSLHDALPIFTDLDGRTMCWSSAGAIGFKGSRKGTPYAAQQASLAAAGVARDQYGMKSVRRSEEHTSELQSREKLVCRPLLEKKKSLGAHNRP